MAGTEVAPAVPLQPRCAVRCTAPDDSAPLPCRPSLTRFAGGRMRGCPRRMLGPLLKVMAIRQAIHLEKHTETAEVSLIPTQCAKLGQNRPRWPDMCPTGNLQAAWKPVGNPASPSRLPLTCQRLGSGWATGPATKMPLPACRRLTCQRLGRSSLDCATHSTFRPGIQASEPATPRRKSGARPAQREVTPTCLRQTCPMPVFPFAWLQVRINVVQECRRVPFARQPKRSHHWPQGKRGIELYVWSDP